MNRIETIILKNLLLNEEYTRKVLPFLQPNYFTNNSEKTLFLEIQEFINKYNSLPSKESIIINLTESKDLTESQLKDTVEIINEIEKERDVTTDQRWLTDNTEKFCQDKAIYNAIMESVQILDNRTNATKSKGEIPKLLSNALAVSFDSHIGHDYINDYSERFDFYHRQESRIPFDLDYFNKITKGGIPNKTLSICLAGTGVGKSMFMCHMAAACISQGLNVLYITLEMAEERIAERIDANLLNVSMQDLHSMTKNEYDKKFEALRVKTHGKLIIKEYPTASANSLHFRSLLNELNLKKNFKPQIIFIDYLNICTSSRLKPGANVNSYSYIKAIAEELRGLAVEFDLPIVSATQTTRSGFTNSDPGLEDTSESFGLPATADFMFALITNEELQQLNQMMVKQLKNRFGDPNHFKRFVIGVDREKMKLYDAEVSAQTDIVDSGQDEDTGPINTFGMREGKFTRNFNGLKV